MSVALALWTSVTAGRTETRGFGTRDVLDPYNGNNVLACSIRQHIEHWNHI